MEEHMDPTTFFAADIRIGTVIQAEVFKEARKPAYKLWIDFGKLGTKKTSAQITVLYKPKELVGKQVVAVVNFPEKQIGNFMSQCLVLGAVGNNNEVTLLTPDTPCKNGLRVS